MSELYRDDIKRKAGAPALMQVHASSRPSKSPAEGYPGYIPPVANPDPEIQSSSAKEWLRRHGAGLLLLTGLAISSVVAIEITHDQQIIPSEQE